MRHANSRFVSAIAFASLMVAAGGAEAQQRARQAPAQTGTHNVNRNANVNRNTNVNHNKNVNLNRNVNVNRNVDVHVWGGAHVHAPRYAWPHGYAYVRRPVGYIMPRAFLVPAYYYPGWAALHLAAPAAGHQWVRYGNDLLLVQIGTGRVVDVRYGVFD